MPEIKKQPEKEPAKETAKEAAKETPPVLPKPISLADIEKRAIKTANETTFEYVRAMTPELTRSAQANVASFVTKTGTTEIQARFWEDQYPGRNGGAGAKNSYEVAIVDASSNPKKVIANLSQEASKQIFDILKAKNTERQQVVEQRSDALSKELLASPEKARDLNWKVTEATPRSATYKVMSHGLFLIARAVDEGVALGAQKTSYQIHVGNKLIEGEPAKKIFMEIQDSAKLKRDQQKLEKSLK